MFKPWLKKACSGKMSEKFYREKLIHEEKMQLGLQLYDLNLPVSFCWTRGGRSDDVLSMYCYLFFYLEILSKGTLGSAWDPLY